MRSVTQALLSKLDFLQPTSSKSFFLSRTRQFYTFRLTEDKGRLFEMEWSFQKIKWTMFALEIK